MLKVVTGRFHPTLESALVDRIRRRKADDPLRPLAIVVPSNQLADRIRTLLAVEHQLSLLNLHILTFHQLALRLADERRAGHSLPRIVDDLFFEQMIRYLVCRKLSDYGPLQRLGRTAGTWGALWATVRDLKDALIDPDYMMRGLREGYFEQEDREWLEALVALYAAVKEFGRILEVGTQNDLAERLTSLVPTSSFLQPLQEVLYYGFYDLTQVQLSFFEAVSRAKDTTLFFPLEDDPAYDFARRFFDRCIGPLIAAVDVEEASKGASSVGIGQEVQLSVWNVIGVQEELAATCRTILELVENNGYRFDDIGVVARSLDPYAPHVRSIFDRHRVPFYTTASLSLIEEPAGKLILQLVSLPLNEWYAPSVLEVVTSPLYATDLYHDSAAAYRPEQWKLVVQALRITRGMDEWSRLKKVGQESLLLNGEEGLFESLAIAPESLALLQRVVSELMQDCSTLPMRGTVGRLVEACQALVARRLRRPDTAPGGENPQAVREAMTWTAIDSLWTTLGELERLNEDVTWGEFVELLTRAVERIKVPLSSLSCPGVGVLDVMAARGVPFKALFLLGLNDRVFPRAIREDGFLRDRHRRVLDATLGYKIDEKLAAYEEERLLFYLSCRSASHRLYLSYQRADESGQVSAASPYLEEARRLYAGNDPPIEVIPRRLTDRLERRPSDRFFIPPADVIQWLALQGEDPTEVAKALGRDGETFEHAMTALGWIEADGQELNGFDGVTGHLEIHWSRLLEQGIAPTPLERYARCPFQYFAVDVLRLEAIRVSFEQGPGAALVGSLCHAALRRCYEQLVRDGWPVERIAEDVLGQKVVSSVAQAAEELEATQGVGPYLLWEMTKELAGQLVRETVAADEEEQQEHPYTPVGFELEGEGVVPGILDDGPLKIRGRVDRLDRHRISGVLRVVDYKVKLGASMKTEDRDLVRSAIRGYRLQPPLYGCLSVSGQTVPRLVQFLFLAPQWSPRIGRSTFEAPSWSSETGLLIRQTLSVLIDGIRAGRFFILPNGYCDGCPYRAACRREHGPTWWRASRAEEAKSLKAMRKREVGNG
ncbi:MAG: exodeoxyribonuclease V subunit gamma [Nitrospira sp.]|nr:exodeoxyribonuclease V subunit gamma [Nitrospira sp.]